MSNSRVSLENHADYLDPEKRKHDRMKLLGRKILLYMGVHSTHVSEEETITVDDKSYRVDLVGQLGRIKIAIECGDNKAEKIDAIRKKYDLVLILPYREFDFESQPEIKLYKKAMEDFEQSTLETYTQREKLKKLQEDYRKLYDQIRYENEKQINQIRKDYDLLNKELDQQRLNFKMLEEFRLFCEGFGKGAYDFPRWLAGNSIRMTCPHCKQDIELREPPKPGEPGHDYWKIVNGDVFCPVCRKVVMKLK